MQFNKLTEAAMQLMDAGEADVYTQNKVRILCSHFTFLCCCRRAMVHFQPAIPWSVALLQSAVSLLLCLEACAGAIGAG